ncbi:hypothetical protein VP01_1184g1 [Puccinia sorghi]|uniref:Uncharacterized protein n=1 Tax=Puccinia sorghi TaxID=27349 RepID=A0A0L6VR10_9BASI|nr:hypothetical protein VP01_1184g1 [Puccinia sorghi]
MSSAAATAETRSYRLAYKDSTPHAVMFPEADWDFEVLIFFTVFVSWPPREGRNGSIWVAPLMFKQPKPCSININTCRTTLEEIQQIIVSHMNQQFPNLGYLVMKETNSESCQNKWIVTFSNKNGILKLKKFNEFLQQYFTNKRIHKNQIKQAAVAQELKNGTQDPSSVNQEGSKTHAELDDQISDKPQINLLLEATIFELYKKHQMAGHLHQGFAIFWNTINPNEGIILLSSTVTICAVSIKPLGVDLTHSGSTLNYFNFKKKS